MKKPYSARRLSPLTCLIIGLASFTMTAHANYLIPPQLEGFTEPCPPPQMQRHHKVHYQPVSHQKCTRCAPREIVQFNPAPAPQGRGHYVEDVYDDYDPDLATGDDDPTIYPDLNINN